MGLGLFLVERRSLGCFVERLIEVLWGRGVRDIGVGIRGVSFLLMGGKRKREFRRI